MEQGSVPRTRLELIARWAAARRGPRLAFNAAYLLVPDRAKWLFRHYVGDLFAGYAGPFASGSWYLLFAGRTFRVPLYARTARSDWDSAIATLSHDPDLKRSYRNAARRFGAPRLVFDVGANTGTHSVLFAALGARVIAFEPNPGCADAVQRLCAANEVPLILEGRAVSDAAGPVDLFYPPGSEAWGTTSPLRLESLSRRFELSHVTVDAVTLDSYATERGSEPDWIKIDTEGNEHEVLWGARRLLRRGRPVVFLESWRPGREAIVELLTEANYALTRPPLPSRGVISTIPPPAFLEAPTDNFIALPRELL